MNPITATAQRGASSSSLRGPSRCLASALLLVTAGGCAAHAGSTIPNAAPVTSGFDLPWKAELDRDHPLVGRIWSTKEQAFVPASAIDAAVAHADFVLLGETHDNPDHHALQARLAGAAASSGPAPALAFEMLESPQQAEVDRALADTGATVGARADSLARAVNWEKSGWPAFSMYRPIVEAGISLHLPIVAANLSHERVREVIRGGTASLPVEVRALMDGAGALPADELEALTEEMRAAHCGALPESMLEPMGLAQRARDAQMALRMIEAATTGRAILITGAGHARSDRGVPSYLRRSTPQRSIVSGVSVVSVGMLEVEKGLNRPAEYAARFGTGSLPFDYVMFTPGARREDPCARFKKQGGRQ